MKLYILLLLLLPAFAIAQPGAGQQGAWREDASALSVFSENGDMFFLVLNGISQNDMPTARIRVEGLPQYGNDIEVIFADKRTPAIRRKITIADPVDGKAVNMTLKIVRDRNGYARLKFHKCEEVERDYRPGKGEFVMGYNDYKRIIATGGKEHEMRIPAAMDAQSFEDLKKTIRSASFDETKLSTAKSALTGNKVNTDQVVDICKLFSFDNTKLDFAKYAYGRTVDQNNYFKVVNVFSFSDSKESLNAFISSGGK